MLTDSESWNHLFLLANALQLLGRQDTATKLKGHVTELMPLFNTVEYCETKDFIVCQMSFLCVAFLTLVFGAFVKHFQPQKAFNTGTLPLRYLITNIVYSNWSLCLVACDERVNMSGLAGKHLLPVLGYEFKSCSGLEVTTSDSNQFCWARCQDFLRLLQFPPLFQWWMVSVDK